MNTTAAYTATELDQFGIPMVAQPAVTWSKSSGGGTLSNAGIYTSPGAAGSVMLSAMVDGLSGTATVSTYDDVLVWYKADTAGATLVDSSGNNQSAPLTGAYSFGAGVTGTALTIGGGYATLPTGVVSSYNDITVAAWVKVTTLQQWSRIFDFGSGIGIYMFLTPQADTGKLRFAITTNSNGAEEHVDGPALTANAWTHLAVTLSGDTATLYVNGVAVASNDTFTLHPTNMGPTTQNYIGKSQWNDPALQGSIDDFRIYSRALTAEQLAKLAQTVEVVVPASASPTPVTGTTTALIVLGADQGGSESSLTYTWATTGTPPAAVTFSSNGTNASKNTTATFAAAGTYNFVVTIVGASGLAATSNVSVAVNAVASGVRVAPSSTTVEAGLSTPFTFGTIDQFGNSLNAVPAVWSVTTGGGTISTSGVYTAPTAAGTSTVTATAAGYGSSSATVTIANDSRAWYQANSSSGTTLTDASGNGRNGTLTNPAGWTSGVSGNALSLTGGRANLPTGIVSGVNDFTIATWFRIDTLSAWSRIFDFGTGTNANMFLTPQANGTDGPLRFAITTGGGANEQRLDGPTLAAGTWYHVAITLSGNIGTMYLNGVGVATNTNMTIHPAALGNTNRNWLGDSQYPGDPSFLGRIDDFRIYEIALSAQQIQQLAQPLITKAPAAGSNPVTTTSTLLSVLATDATAGEAALTYTWSTIGTPPATVSFSANGTNAAKNSTATLTQPGTYDLAVTIVNPVAGLPITSTINLTVILRPGDYNNSGIVDAGDYVLWRKSVGSSTLINRNSVITGPVGQADYAYWRSRFGVSIPASGNSLDVSEAINSSAVEAGQFLKRDYRSSPTPLHAFCRFRRLSSEWPLRSNPSRRRSTRFHTAAGERLSRRPSSLMAMICYYLRKMRSGHASKPTRCLRTADVLTINRTNGALIITLMTR